MRKNVVHILVNKSYFDNIFEPKRKEFERKLGIKLSQPKFTEYLSKKNLGIDIPKMKEISKKFRRK